MCIQSTFSYSFSADRHVKQHHALTNVEGNCLFSRMIFLPLDVDTEVGYWVMQQFTPGSLGTPILFFHCSYINLHCHKKYDFALKYKNFPYTPLCFYYIYGFIIFNSTFHSSVLCCCFE